MKSRSSKFITSDYYFKLKIRNLHFTRTLELAPTNKHGTNLNAFESLLSNFMELMPSKIEFMDWLIWKHLPEIMMFNETKNDF
jgi:hypothetical protein